MYRQEYEKQDYEEILLKAEIRKKQELQQIKRHCCINCVNCGKDCLKLEHSTKNSEEIYYCGNFKEKENTQEKSFRKDIKKYISG